MAKDLGIKGLKVATVTGDDILDRLPEFNGLGLELKNMDTSKSLFQNL